jgi:small subunit ribosomal protein S16
VAVRIRLQRKGAKHMAFYRIVVADSRSPRDGRFIDQLGYYDPLKDPADIKVDTEKALDWFSKGAKPTDTVKSLFARVGIMETWHHIRQGKSYDELRHIEEDARKRMEAAAAMQRRKADESKAAKKGAKADEEAEKPAAKNAGAEATDAREEAAEPAAEPQEATVDAADSAEAESGGEQTAETPDKAPAAEEAAAEPEPEKTEG